MKQLMVFVKKQWISIALLAGVLFIAVYAVKNLRPPGSMSVIEAQAMDMKLMKAPTGVYPVGADYALERLVGESRVFPATIMAFNDEDAVARVSGLLKNISVYPGDRVKKGQLLATIQADELNQASNSKFLEAESAKGMVRSAESVVEQAEAMLSFAQSEVSTSDASISIAESQLQAETSQLESARNAYATQVALVDDYQAQFDYAQVDHTRKARLYNEGVIAKKELDAAERELSSTRSKLSSQKAKVAEANSQVTRGENLVIKAQKELELAKKKKESALKLVIEAQAKIKVANSDVASKKSMYDAAAANSRSQATITSYLEIRAQENGIVTERMVSPGTPVMVGQIVLKIKSSGNRRIQADIPQSLSSLVDVGRTVILHLGNRSFETKLTSVFHYVDPKTRTFKVEALFPFQGNNWDVGSYIKMEILTSEAVRTLSVRSEAIKTNSDGSHYVWKIVKSEEEPDPDAKYTCTMHPNVSNNGPGLCPLCKMDLVPVDAKGNTFVEKVKVVTGAKGSAYTQIISGLEAGDQVTYAGDTEMFPHAAVQVVEWDENGPKQLPKSSTDADHSHENVSKEPEKPLEEQESSSPPKKESESGLWTCPMHPEVVQDHPGICPICKMDLVPQEEMSEGN